jgi:S-adenosylhomocysteine hydrolase
MTLANMGRVRRLLAVVLLACVAMGGRARAGEPPTKLSLYELARRLHHPANLMALDSFRHELGSQRRPSGGTLIRTPDDRIIRLNDGAVAPLVAQKGSRFGQQLSSRLSGKPFTLISGISIAEAQAPHPWSAPQQGNDWMSHFRGELVNTFAEFADEHGDVDLARVRADVGAGPLRNFIDQVSSREMKADIRVPSHQLFAYLSPAARKQVMEPLRGKIVPEGMRTLAWLSKRFAKERATLAQKSYFGVEHLVGNTSGLLQEIGLDPKTTSLWGKPYSIETVVANDLVERGFTIHADEFRRDQPRFIAALREKLRAIDPARTPARQFVLMDDGGELILAVAALVKNEFPEHAKLFTSAEKTTKGIRIVRELAQKGELPFPVVDIASSWAKLKWGSPMYGYAIAHEAQRIVDQYATQSNWRPSTMVLFGYGPIGRAAAHGAQRLAQRRLIVYDPDPERQKLARADGFEVETNREAALAQAELLVSAVGGPTLADADLPHLPKTAIVVNGASAREFSLTESDRTLNRTAQHHPIDDHHQSATFHDFSGQLDLDHVVYNIFDSSKPPAPGQRIGYVTSFAAAEKAAARGMNVRAPDRVVVAAKGGGVMNFPQTLDGSYGGSAVPGRYIQLDIGLQYIALLQSQSETCNGCIAPLNDKWQRDLVGFVEADLHRQGQTLKRPSW